MTLIWLELGGGGRKGEEGLSRPKEVGRKDFPVMVSQVIGPNLLQKPKY